MKPYSPLVQNALNVSPLTPDFQEKYQSLIEMCRSNLAKLNEDLIWRAYVVAHWAHRNDNRKSGEPYFLHPIEVALITVRDIGMDDISVATALLHDTVEDTEVTLDMIRTEFGDEVALLINGLTKIDEVFKSKEISRAENWRKLILYMASDMRVIMVKFADRLHNMRTLGAKSEQAQLRTAHETMDFFVPLAHRFGIFKVKSELEDLCLKVIDRPVFTQIARGLDEKKEERDRYIEDFMEPIRQQLEEIGLKFIIKGRSKSIFSIYNKMKRQGKTLDEIYDLFAIRVIMERRGAEGKEDCWRAYSHITDQYKPLPERFRDFISMPKSNGYQSLHTTVVGARGKRVEIQIRTKEMDEIAERGVAAHWKYKEGTTGQKMGSDEFYAWVRDALLNDQATDSASEFVKDFRLNLFTEEIHVFTPKGEIINLPKDATPVDFAFMVHTEVGMHCVGAKVNGKMVPLSTKLRNSDEVTILTSKKQTPKPDWIQFVVTQKAKSRIRAWIKEQRRQYLDKGREILLKALKRAKLEPDEQHIDRAARLAKYQNSQEMYYALGSEAGSPEEIIRQLPRVQQGESKDLSSSEVHTQHYENFLGTAQSTSSLLVNGETFNNMPVQYATCCNPIPGDEVFGLISGVRGIRIHRTTCKNAKDILMNNSDRVVNIEWSRSPDQHFVAGLKVIGSDRVGMFNDLSTVISKKLKINIRSIQVSGEQGLFEGTFVVDIANLTQLEGLMKKLHTVRGVHEVFRFEG